MLSNFTRMTRVHYFVGFATSAGVSHGAVNISTKWMARPSAINADGCEAALSSPDNHADPAQEVDHWAPARQGGQDSQSSVSMKENRNSRSIGSSVPVLSGHVRVDFLGGRIQLQRPELRVNER